MKKAVTLFGIWTAFRMNVFSFFLFVLYVGQVDAKRNSIETARRRDPSNPVSIIIANGTALIVNGNDANRGEYPFQAMLFYGGGQRYSFTCGGTILNRNYILTAAHCLYGKATPRNYIVAVGKHEMYTDSGSEQYSNVDRIVMHENYDNDKIRNDIALLELATPLTYSKYVKAVTLADVGQKTNKKCWTSGFGVVRQSTNEIASILQELKAKAIGRKKCKRIASNYGAADLIDNTVVCTKTKRSGACSGDSGGPLGCYDGNKEYTQFGVLSWGSATCTLGFNVYTRVSEFRNWISTNMS